MQFVDELTINAKAGDGGDGIVRWRHTRNKEFAGPSGGNGGPGGNVYAVAVRDVHLLGHYRHRKEFRAEDGHGGRQHGEQGRGGEDLEIQLPVGSVITNTATKERFSLDAEGQRELLLRGGRGGRGNESFKSSTNRAPDWAKPGDPGEEGEFHIELELIADIGLIGLPNAGKTTLLNAMSRANAKVGAYPFTTLEPNLGEAFGFIIADIPGLIEGAAEGKGLGHKFLRHVRRTKMLVHLVSLENEDVLVAYQTIRREMEQFDRRLLEKDEIVVLTKTDLISEEGLTQARKRLEKAVSEVWDISLYDDDAIKRLRDELLRRLQD